MFWTLCKSFSHKLYFKDILHKFYETAMNDIKNDAATKIHRVSAKQKLREEFELTDGKTRVLNQVLTKVEHLLGVFKSTNCIFQSDLNFVKSANFFYN